MRVKVYDLDDEVQCDEAPKHVVAYSDYKALIARHQKESVSWGLKRKSQLRLLVKQSERLKRMSSRLKQENQHIQELMARLKNK